MTKKPAKLITSWNVNGLRAVLRKGSLRKFIDQYHPDILMLQETKISAPQIAESDVEDEFSDYQQYYTSAQRAGYAGTAIWVKKNWNEVQPVAIDFDADGLTDQYGDTLNEGRVTVVETPKLYIVSVYVPNAKDDLSRLQVRQQWDHYLANFISHLQATKPVILGGDLNVAHEPIDLARPKQNIGKHGFTDEERQGFSTLLKQTKLTDTFRTLHPDTQKYSWWSHWGNARANNVGWRIDYLLTSDRIFPQVASADIYDQVQGSDHCPVAIQINLGDAD